MMMMMMMTTAGKALSRTVTLRQAKQPPGTSSLDVVEMSRSQGEPFKIERQRTTAPWYPQPLYEWKTGRMHDKEQKTFVLSARVQLDSETGRLLVLCRCTARLLQYCEYLIRVFLSRVYDTLHPLDTPGPCAANTDTRQSFTIHIQTNKPNTTSDTITKLLVYGLSGDSQRR